MHTAVISLTRVCVWASTHTQQARQMQIKEQECGVDRTEADQSTMTPILQYMSLATKCRQNIWARVNNSYFIISKEGHS